MFFYSKTRFRTPQEIDLQMSRHMRCRTGAGLYIIASKADRVRTTFEVLWSW